MARVSVVIASYNHEQYVQETIESVLNQDFQDFEIVVTDDGSADTTADSIRGFNDSRIQLHCFDTNKGACTAINHSIRHSGGEYLAVLNTDDVFCAGKLKKQVDFLDCHPEIGAVFGYPVIIDEQGHELNNKAHREMRRVFTQPNRSRYEWLNLFFFGSNCLCHPSVMIRRECYDNVGLYDERFAQLPDYDLWIRLCLKYNIHILPENMVKFRVFSTAQNASARTSENLIRTQWEHRHILEHYLKIRDKQTLRAVFPEAGDYGDNYENTLIPFIIAQLAFNRHSDNNFSQSFALDTIGTLLKKPELVRQLEQVFNFKCRDFIRMTGQYDVYNKLVHKEFKKIKRHPVKYILGIK